MCAPDGDGDGAPSVVGRVVLAGGKVRVDDFPMPRVRPAEFLAAVLGDAADGGGGDGPAVDEVVEGAVVRERADAGPC